jgi:Transposase DDE domain
MAGRDRFAGTPGGTGPGQEPDAPAGSAAPDAGRPHGAEPAQARLEVYGDSAYGSGEARAAYRDAGHDTVIKPGPLRPAVPGGFTIDDFTIDEQAGTVTCPAGHARPMSAATRTVNFGDLCAGCPLRPRCTTARDGRSTRIHPHEDLLRAARVQARTDDFKKAYPTRSAIERIISWTATQNGRRIKLRYLGAIKNNAWLHTRCAAINLRTLLRHGLTRRDGAWILA